MEKVLHYIYFIYRVSQEIVEIEFVVKSLENLANKYDFRAQLFSTNTFCPNTYSPIILKLFVCS